MHIGSCLCGQVTFNANNLIGPYVYCHCRSCRKASGSAFAANIAVKMQDFEVVTGADDLHIFESSPNKLRHSCQRCASPLFTTVGLEPAYVRIRLGSLDSDFSEPPTAHIFTAEKAAWNEIHDAANCYESWPDSDAVQIPGSRQAT